MTDTRLDQYIVLGTAAQRGSFTPDPGPSIAGTDMLVVFIEYDTGDAYYWDTQAGPAAWVAWPGGGGGDVVGPGSAVDDNIATFDGTTGKLIQDGGQTIAEVIAAAVAAGVQDFVDLGDVPASYSGAALQVVRVNAGETGLEFAAGGGGSGALEFVTSTVVAGAAATSMSVAGLDLDTDGRYMVMVTIKNATTSSADISMTYNADTTATNYNRQQLVATSTSVSATRANNAQIGGLDSNTASTGSGNFRADITISKDVDTKPISIIKTMRTGNSNILIQDWVHEWKTTGTNVTGITITSSIASSLAIGSKIEVWKINT